MAFLVTIRKNNIPQVRASVTNKSVDAVRDSAKRMRDHAQSIAPVRTGAFRASLYINGPNGESDYFQHAAEAKALNPSANIVPEFNAAIVNTGVRQLRNDLGQFSQPEAVMGSAVEYSIYIEEGTVRMAPRPVFFQSALFAERFFLDLMSKVADGF